MTAFDRGAFWGRLDEIERYLGYLKGNEMVRKFWDEVQAAQNYQGYNGALGINYQSTPPEWDYGCEFFYSGMPIFGDGTPEAQDVGQREMHASVDAAWRSGGAWASGMAGYLREICATFTDIDGDSAKSTIDDIGAVRFQVVDAVESRWTTINVEHWQGHAHTQFEDFYKHLHEQAQDYAAYLALAENWVAAVGALAVGAQAGLGDLVDQVLANIKAQLIEWHNTQGTPMDHHAVPRAYAKVATIAGDVIALVPAGNKVGKVIASATVVVGETQALVKLMTDLGVHGDMGPQNGDDYRVNSSEDIYNDLVSTLMGDFLDPFTAALGDLGDRSAPLRADLEGLQQHHRFFPAEVPGARGMDWAHDGEPGTTSTG